MKSRCLFFAILLLIPAVVQAQEKPMITVLDFKTSGVSGNEMNMIISLLSSALFKTGKYTVIDVSERDTLLGELGFSFSGCADESCQLEIGQMLSAEAIVIGSIGKVGGSYIISVKMLETETARTLNTADGIYENMDLLVKDVSNIVRELVNQSESNQTEANDADIVNAESTPDMEEEFTGNFFSLKLRAGLNLPLGQVSQVYAAGIPSVLTFSYNQILKMGIIGFGLSSGFTYQPTEDDIRYVYTMYTIPIGASVRYSIHELNPFVFSAFVDGGVMLNIIIFSDEDPLMHDDFAVTPYISPGIGIGCRISKNICLGINAELPMVFFHEVTALGIAFDFFLEFRF